MIKVQFNQEPTKEHCIFDVSYFATNGGFYIIDNENYREAMCFSETIGFPALYSLKDYETIEEFCADHDERLLGVWESYDAFDIFFREKE